MTICFFLKRKLTSNLRVASSVLPRPASIVTSYGPSQDPCFSLGNHSSLSLPSQCIEYHWHWPQPHFWAFRRKHWAVYSVLLATVVHGSTVTLTPGTFFTWTSGKERLYGSWKDVRWMELLSATRALHRKAKKRQKQLSNGKG